MIKIKIKYIILILLFIFLIYNFFTYKEHFDEEVDMPNLTTTDTIPKLVFKSYEGCPKLYHIFRGLKDDKGNIENVDGLRFKNKIVSKFFNLDNIVIEERPIIDVSRETFSIALNDNIFLLFLKDLDGTLISSITEEYLLENNIFKDIATTTDACEAKIETPSGNCKPNEVINLLPVLEDKKKFIDRVMTLIIGKVDAKFIKYLIDYRTMINQEILKLTRIKVSPEFKNQENINKYFESKKKLNILLGNEVEEEVNNEEEGVEPNYYNDEDLYLQINPLIQDDDYSKFKPPKLIWFMKRELGKLNEKKKENIDKINNFHNEIEKIKNKFNEIKTNLTNIFIYYYQVVYNLTLICTDIYSLYIKNKNKLTSTDYTDINDLKTKIKNDYDNSFISSIDNLEKLIDEFKENKDVFSNLFTKFQTIEGPEIKNFSIVRQENQINIVEKNGNTDDTNNYFTTKDNDNKRREELFRVKEDQDKLYLLVAKKDKNRKTMNSFYYDRFYKDIIQGTDNYNKNILKILFDNTRENLQEKYLDDSDNRTKIDEYFSSNILSTTTLIDNLFDSMNDNLKDDLKYITDFNSYLINHKNFSHANELSNFKTELSHFNKIFNELVDENGVVLEKINLNYFKVIEEKIIDKFSGTTLDFDDADDPLGAGAGASDTIRINISGINISGINIEVNNVNLGIVDNPNNKPKIVEENIEKIKNKILENMGTITTQNTILNNVINTNNFSKDLDMVTGKNDFDKRYENLYNKLTKIKENLEKEIDYEINTRIELRHENMKNYYDDLTYGFQGLQEIIYGQDVDLMFQQNVTDYNNEISELSTLILGGGMTSLPTKLEFDKKISYEIDEETEMYLIEIMKNLLNFIETNGGKDNLDLKPNLEFKYNGDSGSIEYDKENHIEQDEKQVISKVKVNFTEEDVVNFTEYCFNKLCYKVISIDQLTFTGNHFRALKCNNCHNFYELPERIRKQAMEEGKEYTRAKCTGCCSNIIVYFNKVPKMFTEYGELDEEPDTGFSSQTDKKIEDLISNS